jgi:hypothetical protein
LRLAFNTRLHQELLDVFVEFFLSVILSDFNGETLHLVHTGGEASHGLTTGTTDSDQESVTSLLSQNSRHSRQMLDTVTEEHKVHWGIFNVVNFKAFIKLRNKLISLTEFHILGSIFIVTKENILVVFNFPAHVKI